MNRWLVPLSLALLFSSCPLHAGRRPGPCVVYLKDFGVAESGKHIYLPPGPKALTTEKPILILQNSFRDRRALVVRADVLAGVKSNEDIARAYRSALKKKTGSGELPNPTAEYLSHFYRFKQEYSREATAFNNVISQEQLLYRGEPPILRTTVEDLINTMIPKVVVSTVGKPVYVLLPLSAYALRTPGEPIDPQHFVTWRRGSSGEYYETSLNNFALKHPKVFFEDYGPYGNLPAVKITDSGETKFVGLNPKAVKQAPIGSLLQAFGELSGIAGDSEELKRFERFVKKYRQAHFEGDVARSEKIEGDSGIEFLKKLRAFHPVLVRHQSRKDRLILIALKEPPAVQAAVTSSAARSAEPAQSVAPLTPSSIFQKFSFVSLGDDTGYYKTNYADFEEFMNVWNGQKVFENFRPAALVELPPEYHGNLALYSFASLKGLSAQLGDPAAVLAHLHQSLSGSELPTLLRRFFGSLKSAHPLIVLTWAQMPMTSDPAKYRGEAGKTQIQTLIREDKIGVLVGQQETLIFVPIRRQSR